jgi:predicted transposase/invertase (TIGR01784 family)
MAIQANPAIAKAEELLHRLGSLDEVRRYYEAREKTIRDEANRLAGAREAGWEKGREKGEAIGEARGKINEKLETASKILAKGLPDNLIMGLTGLTLDEIAKLKTTN